MPLIRYIYGPDIRQHGNQPVRVLEMEARVLCDDMRRAVRVSEDDLADLTKPELAQLADQVGADVKARDSKGQFAKKISEADEQ